MFRQSFIELQVLRLITMGSFFMTAFARAHHCTNAALQISVYFLDFQSAMKSYSILQIQASPITVMEQQSHSSNLFQVILHAPNNDWI